MIPALAIAGLLAGPPALESVIRRHAPGLLTRYRVPESRDIGGDWDRLEYAVDGRPPIVAVGDFNADGRSDKAFLLLSRAGRGYGAFVLFLSRRGESTLVTLEENAHAVAQHIGVYLVKPGRYVTCAGRGHAEVRDQPPVLALQRDGVELRAFEVAASYFVWDKRANRFTRHCIAD